MPETYLGTKVSMFALSHNQVMSLVQIDWEAPDCPLKLNDTLTLADLKSSPLLKHTRLFLTHLDTDKGVKLTAKGNLNRKFVSQMLDKFPWPDYDVATTRRMHKVINEEDFMPLHFIRVICEVAKLTRKYKDHLHLSHLGRSLLEEDTAGSLMSELFISNFQRFDLSYMDGFQEEDDFISEMGLILYGISKLTDDYTPSVELANLPLDPVKYGEDHLSSGWIFECRVLRYLYWFGLMEKRPQAANDQRFKNYVYRKTALFDRFMQFELPD
jgi:hypothetical protein